MPESELSFPLLVELAPDRRARAREIYESSFPPRQRDDFEAFLEADADYRASAVMSHGHVVGIAFARHLRLAPWWFVEYVAIARERRSAGIGAQVWEHLRAPAQLSGATGLVLEVEDPGEQKIGPDERLIRERRIRFWERCGGGILPVDRFVVPTFDGSGTERLLLMAYPVDEAQRPDVLASLVRAIYVDGYGLAEDHPLVHDATDGLVDDS
jgi:GNAT superfamily N-acetyltransferase